jgi:hypothetical protein
MHNIEPLRNELKAVEAAVDQMSAQVRRVHFVCDSRAMREDALKPRVFDTADGRDAPAGGRTGGQYRPLQE